MNGQVINNDTEFVWCYLYDILKNPYAVAGLMGTMYHYTRLNPTFGHEWYTQNVDSGQYDMDSFVHDKNAYGLMQWSYWGDKQSLYNMARKRHSSIGNLSVQMELIKEDLTLSTTFKDVYVALQNCDSVIQAVEIVLSAFYGGRDRIDYDRNDVNLTMGYGLYYLSSYKCMPENPLQNANMKEYPNYWIRVTKNRTAIRGAASIIARKIETADKGDEYRYATTSHNGNWRGIFCKDRIGWISSKYSEIYTRTKTEESNQHIDR